MDKIKWSEDKIISSIKEVMNFLDIKRMPSHSEIREYYGNDALTNKIAKTGGSHAWAKRLDIPMKECDSEFGHKLENEIKSLLEVEGFQCELTAIRFPYDILVNGCVKIDVKAARKTKVHQSDVFSFRIAKTKPTCDLYMAACMDKEDIKKLYVIPAHIMTGKSQLTVGINESKYDKYINRLDLVSDYVKAFTNMS